MSPSIRLDTIDVGSVVWYVLLPRDRPTNPDKQWRGKVERVIKNAYNDRQGMCCVRSIEPGYEGLGECVFFSQIVSIEGGSP